VGREKITMKISEPYDKLSSEGTGNFVTPNFNPGQKSNKRHSEFHRNGTLKIKNNGKYIFPSLCPVCFCSEMYDERYIFADLI
jgi:hypothetical protein